MVTSELDNWATLDSLNLASDFPIMAQLPLENDKKIINWNNAAAIIYRAVLGSENVQNMFHITFLTSWFGGQLKNCDNFFPLLESKTKNNAD